MTAVRYLGWDGPFLPRVADALVDEHGPDLGGVVVALPGSRAVRRLEELLAERLADAGDAAVPPEMTTAGRLSDRLLVLEAPVAGRLVRTLAWARVLRDRPTDALRPLLATPPSGETFDGWWALASELRSLHGALGGEGLGFDAVRDELRRAGPAGERVRWDLLVELQRAYRGELAALGLEDPHESRRDAVEGGRVDRPRHVVLAGVTEVGRLLRRCLVHLPGAVTALVAAPDSEAERFDELGCVRPDAWPGITVPLERATWRVATGPEGQAEAAADALGALDGRLAAAEITVGVADEEVVPSLERHLASRGVATRRAAGTAVAASPVVALLRAVSRELRQRDFTASSALLRHPDVERHLAADGARLPAAAADAFAAHHVPRSRALSRELPRDDDRHRARRLNAMAEVHRALDRLLGDLGRDPAEARAVSAWVPSIAGFLGRLHGDRTWDADALGTGPASERVLAASLSAVGEVLRELAVVPSALGDAMPVTAGEAVDVLLRGLVERTVPEPPDDDAVELVGWLDLAHDTASAVVLTGFNEGRLPAGVRGHAFLPDGLRRRLGLPDDAQRLARDLHALVLLLESGREVTLVSGRRDAHGDPLQPSRLAFHAPDDLVLERVGRWLPAGDESRGEARRGAPERRALPVADGHPVPEALSVTAFRDHLASPYLFYLRRVLRLETVEPPPRELDPLVFGNLAHDVLEAFANGEARDAQDAELIAEDLDARLAAEAARQFGAHPLPAVSIQLERLRYRFRAFAEWQAGWRAEGWRIHAVEWPPEDTPPATLDVDGEPFGLRGRIDRVDRNERTGEWAVIDYKTGESGDTPKKTHGPRDDGRWTDLQLPLYRVLVQPLLDEAGAGRDAVVRLGYVPLARRTEATEFAQGDWDEGELASAVECARDVVRDLRAGRLFELGDFPDRDPVLAAIAGRGLLAEQADDEREAES